MDLTTRFILAWDISDTKENYNATPLLRAAKDRAGKIPRPYITDGLGQYHIAFKKVFYTKGPQVNPHTRHSHMEPFLQHQQTGATQRRIRKSIQSRPQHKRKGVADIPHCRTTPQLHQATRRIRRQDTCRGRRHRHTWN